MLMLDSLDRMLKSVEESKEKNEMLNKEATTKKQQEKDARRTNVINKESKEVLMIQSLGLNIDIYEPADPNVEYYNAHDYYYCSNDKWSVVIRDILYDPDIDSILQVLEMTDKTTGEKLDFYCDLWCRNTHKHKLKQFKYLLNHSKEEYLHNEYGQYYDIPKLLNDRGYKIKENNYTFDLNGCLGKLEIQNPTLSDKHCELAINHYNGISIYLKSPKMKSKFSIFDEEITYPINYKNKNDLQTLCDQINSIVMHIDGKIGYEEHDEFFSNKHIEKLFNQYEAKLDYIADVSDSYQYACWYNENPTEKEIAEYEKMNKISKINKYNGAEIYKKYEVEIEHDSYHFGGISNSFAFEIIYNTTIDKDNCLLKIVHTKNAYYGRNNILNEDKNEDQNELNSKTSSFECKGKFSKIYNTIEKFLKSLTKLQ